VIAKTGAQRQADYKKRQAGEGRKEVRGIFLHPEDAAALREHAAKLNKRRERLKEKQA
jgi:hypothetical protein